MTNGVQWCVCVCVFFFFWGGGGVVFMFNSAIFFVLKMQSQERNVCALLMKLLMSWYNVVFLTSGYCRFGQVLIFLVE